MAQLQNLFSLLDSDEDASSIIGAALAAVKSDDNKNPPQKIESNTRRGSVHNSMMTKPNRHIFPHGSRPQNSFTKERSDGEKQERYGNYRDQTENQHLVANGNGNFNNGDKPYNNYTNNTRNYGVPNGGFQGSFRKNFEGINGYQGYPRGGNYYNRNRRYDGNNFRRNNYGGVVNSKKKEVVVDADGFQVYVGRKNRGRLTPDNQSQASGDSFNGGRSYTGNSGTDLSNLNNGGIEETCSNISEKVQNETKGVEIKSFEAGSDGTETITTATKGDKDSKESKKSKKSGKDKHEGQDNSKTTKKWEAYEYKRVFTLKEYEKDQLVKREALDSLKQNEQRKVLLDKEFEYMVLVDKKNNEDKLNSEKEAVAKKKEIRKVMSIDEFLEPGNGNGEWRRRRRFIDRLNKGEETEGNESNNNGGNGSSGADFAAIIADANQFPALA